MAWIKRNLFFVVGGVVALILMGVAGYYLYSNYQEVAIINESLQSQVTELNRLYGAGLGGETNVNLGVLKSDQEKLKAFLNAAKDVFPPPPVYTNLDDQHFKALLLNSIVELQNEATNNGVILPKDYKFTFTQQIPKFQYTSNNIPEWIRELGEIKMICRILFSSRINSLESIKRVAYPPEDRRNGPETLSLSNVTDSLALYIPYEINFRGFSSEIASVMDGFLRATNCFIVKTINIEPSRKSVENSVIQRQLPASIAPTVPQIRKIVPKEVDRYNNVDVPKVGVPRVPGAVPGAPLPPQTVLSERQLRVTMFVEVVKIKPFTTSK